MKKNDVLFDGLGEYLIALLRYGVLDEKPTIIQPSSQVDWDRMMDIASVQGILAWVWDGICKLPKEFQPPRQQAINWGLSAQEIWDRNNTQKKVLRQMIDVCSKNNIRLLLFKGIALSELYPKPESRPSGDIDIYLFEDYSRGDQLFAHENVTKTHKRTGFDFKGVHIENHRIFLNTYTKKQKNAVAYLEESLKDATLTKDGYYMMSPIASIVYQVMHFMAHFDDVANPLSLRFVVDFGVTLKHYQSQISSNELETILRRIEIFNTFCLLLCLVKEIMNIDYEFFSCERVGSKDTHAALKLIFERQGNSVPLIERPLAEIVLFYFYFFKKYVGIHKYLSRSKSKFISHHLSKLMSIIIRRILHIPNNC